MKFIYGDDAPDIPLDVIEAQESGDLVLFCGAGVSKNAGLPLFDELIDRIYSMLNEKKEGHEDGSFLDRTIGLLEQRIGRERVRKVIVSVLGENSKNLSTHEAILELSKTKNKKNGYRLVTTNVDRYFVQASNEEAIIDFAPKLPIPRDHKWHSVVHLHGLIDPEDDPLGENLIFSSGDFGLAYLVDRWASRFIVELFRNFNVLFVGYSLKDPILRYIVDAISSEKDQGDNKTFMKSYILLHDSEKSEASWELMKLNPIFYSGSHKNLHDTLIGWASYSRDKLGTIEKKMKNVATNRPTQLYSEGQQWVIDILKKKSKFSDVKHAATVFRDHPAPIEWLPILDDNNLLSMPNVAEEGSVKVEIASNSVKQNTISPCQVTFILWEWMLKYIDQPSVIRFIISKGVILPPIFLNILSNHIAKIAGLDGAYKTFWNVFLFRLNFPNFSEDYNFQHVISQSQSLGNSDAMLSECVLKSFTPYIHFNEEPSSLNGSEFPPYRAEVKISLQDWMYEQLCKRNFFVENSVKFLFSTTGFLHQTMRYWEMLGFAGDRERSHWDMPSIDSHEQNKQFHNWVYLIEINRDLWTEVYSQDERFAMSILSMWSAIDYPVFRRLTLHIYATFNVVDTDRMLDCLLDNNGYWLWANSVRRENFRLIDKLYNFLTLHQKEKLLDYILAGPRPADYKSDSCDEQSWKSHVDRQVWRYLSKIRSFDGELNAVGNDRLASLSIDYPEWKLQSGDRDEFVSWFEVREGYDVDINESDMLGCSDGELLKLLTDDDKRYRDGRLDQFRKISLEQPKRATDFITYCVKNDIWEIKIWRAALTGLASAADVSWRTIAPLLFNAPEPLYAANSHSIAFWLKSSTKAMDNESNGLFWKIVNTLLDSVTSKPAIDDDNDVVFYAINDPVGLTVEAALAVFEKCKPSKETGINDAHCLAFLKRIIEEPNFLLGRVILAARLPAFYAIDSSWTKEQLLPEFNWQSADSEAIYLWQGYLWSPSISLELAVDLKKSLKYALGKIQLFSKEHQKQLIHLTTLICINYNENVYSIQEQKDFFKSFEIDQLWHASQYIRLSLNQDSMENDIYWGNRVQHFVKAVWPKNIDKHSPNISVTFAMCLVKLKDEFPRALSEISDLLVPCSDTLLLIFFNWLADSTLPEDNAQEVFQLLLLVLGDITPTGGYNRQPLAQIIDRLLAVDPEIKNSHEFSKIKDWLN